MARVGGIDHRGGEVEFLAAGSVDAVSPDGEYWLAGEAACCTGSIYPAAHRRSGGNTSRPSTSTGWVSVAVNCSPGLLRAVEMERSSLSRSTVAVGSTICAGVGRGCRSGSCCTAASGATAASG